MKKINLLVLILFLLIITGCNNLTSNSISGYSNPEKIFISMEDAFLEKDFNSLSKLFTDIDYAFTLKDLFFRQEDNVSLSYGFPDDEFLKQSLITTNDLENIIPGKIKYIDDNTALTAIRLKTEKLNLFTGVVLQKFDGKWKITRLYDFLVIESNMMEVSNFYLDFFKQQFDVTFKISEYIQKQGLQTTFIYNTYLLIDKIDVNYHNLTLCSFDKNDFTMKVLNKIIVPDKDNLFMVDELNIKGNCDFSQIMSTNLEDKYFLDIVFYLKNGLIMKAYYYGDLRL